MGMFVGESGKESRRIDAGKYDEIEDIYSCIGDCKQHKYWFNCEEEDDYE